MATPDGDSLDVNVVAVLDATAPADRAPTRTAPADTLPAGAQPVPVDTDWAADTPVQVAYLEGVDDPAPAETKVKVGIFRFGWLYLEAVHRFSKDQCTGVNNHGRMTYARVETTTASRLSSSAGRWT